MSANVVCLKWGSKYSSEYVNRLYSMVKRTLTLEHRFVCVTEDPAGLASGIEVKPIEEPELTGWWHKITLFKRRIYDLEGPILFLDLDLVIIGHLDRFFEHAGRFCIIDDWNPRRISYNSAVFRVDIGAYSEVWDEFYQNRQEIMLRLHGDQQWLTKMLPDAVGWPKGWVKSFKIHLDCRGSIGTVPFPAETPIVAFHGRPQPHEVKDRAWGEYKHAPWINEYWR